MDPIKILKSPAGNVDEDVRAIGRVIDDRDELLLIGFVTQVDRLDAVSEAIARAWEKRGTLRDEALFSTWMTRILIRVCVDIQRRQKRMTPVDTLPETPTGEDSCAALREAVDSLPQKLRTMVVLYYMEGYEVLEVARIMGTTKGAVCAGLSRAREKLRAMLGEEER